MTPKKFLVLLWALSFAGAALPARAYQPAELWFHMVDPGIVESSGVAASGRTDDIIFTHNDSADLPRYFAVRTSDGQTASVFGLGAVIRKNLDWEDMARGPGRDGNPALFFGDIGDNFTPVPVRPNVIVYEIPEPVVDASQTGLSAATPPAVTTVLVYEDGPHNAETLLFDPASGRFGIVTKVPGGVSGVYLAEPAAGDVQVLRRVATIDLAALGATSDLTTGGDVAPDGSRVVVRTYNEAFEWAIPPDGLAAAFAGTPTRIPLPVVPGGEAVGYTRDGSSLMTTTEGGHAPVHLLRGA